MYPHPAPRANFVGHRRIAHQRKKPPVKILSVEQIRALDAWTIEHEPIPSLDLMERAARTFKNWFAERYPDRDRRVCIFCGPGNNGGDGLAVARMLAQDFYEVEV